MSSLFYGDISINEDEEAYISKVGLSLRKIDPSFDPFINHVHKLEELTGFKPITESHLHPAESITHFINRAMEKLQFEGRLDEVKL